jgi:hypothetical protein
MGEDDPGRLSRRRVLTGFAGAVGVGTLGGAGTRAFFGDTEGVPGSLLGNPYAGGYLDLELSCHSEDESCSVRGDGIELALTRIDPPAHGRVETCLEIGGGQAWVWLKSTPPFDRAVANELLVTLAYPDGTPVTDPTGEPVEQRPLNGFLGAFQNGGLLRGPDADGTYGAAAAQCLTLSWSLLERDPSLSGQRAEFGLEFAAVQYRSETNPNNPWSERERTQ